MTDKRIKEPCPFCGEKAENIELNYHIEQWEFVCPTCGAIVTFNTWKDKSIEKYNQRNNLLS